MRAQEEERRWTQKQDWESKDSGTNEFYHICRRHCLEERWFPKPDILEWPTVKMAGEEVIQ